jgi:hypothetical protein
MNVNQKCIIKGAGFFDGEVEGTTYNSGQLFIEEPFDRTKANYKGFRTVEYKCMDADVVKPLMHLEFPITADVSMEISATKRGQQIVVTTVKPIGLAQPTPSANQKAA